MLENATMEIRAFCNVYRISEFFLKVCTIDNQPGTII